MLSGPLLSVFLLGYFVNFNNKVVGLYTFYNMGLFRNQVRGWGYSGVVNHFLHDALLIFIKNRFSILFLYSKISKVNLGELSDILRVIFWSFCLMLESLLFSVRCTKQLIWHNCAQLAFLTVATRHFFPKFLKMAQNLEGGQKVFELPYARHHNPLLIWNRSWL